MAKGVPSDGWDSFFVSSFKFQVINHGVASLEVVEIELKVKTQKKTKTKN
jgi:hypothetical protein